METPSTLHLDFQHVYEPAEDTFLLLDAIEQDLTWLRSLHPQFCVEVGSGSGVVISAVCRALDTFCLATDINPIACAATQATAQHHGVSHLLQVVRADLLSPLRLRGMVDVLIFNPPYVPSEPHELEGSGISRAWAGGQLGREVTDRLLPLVSSLLSPQGVFYLLLLRENRPREVAEQLEKQGLVCKVVLERRAGREALLVLRASAPQALAN